ncbi:MAG: glutathione peroxidase [Clostridia bacterium]|nr:glutathione peroxidase [Clostridia bacterium]
MDTNIYDIEFRDKDGKAATLEPYEGKVLLIVNTATHCGFTPQYEGLEELYRDYKDRGFEVLDFPCNQFGGQAPGSAEEIDSFCDLNYNTSFPRFEKIDVNGSEEAPLYTYLKDRQGGILGKAIKWNFTKFLVDREGNVTGRFAPQIVPGELREEIEALL